MLPSDASPQIVLNPVDAWPKEAQYKLPTRDAWPRSGFSPSWPKHSGPKPLAAAGPAQPPPRLNQPQQHQHQQDHQHQQQRHLHTHQYALLGPSHQNAHALKSSSVKETSEDIEKRHTHMHAPDHTKLHFPAHPHVRSQLQPQASSQLHPHLHALLHSHHHAHGHIHAHAHHVQHSWHPSGMHNGFADHVRSHPLLSRGENFHHDYRGRLHYNLSLSSVYVYPPENFLMYTRCAHLLRREKPQITIAHGKTTYKHNTDYFFVRAVTSSDFLAQTSADPASARLHVVPVMCSQSYLGRCGDHNENLHQLKAKLAHSPHLSTSLLLCDEHKARERVEHALPGALFAAFESWRAPFAVHNATPWQADFIAVGDTTHVGCGACKRQVEMPLASRHYDMTVVMETLRTKKTYAHRRELWCDAVLHGFPSSMFISSPDVSCGDWGVSEEVEKKLALYHTVCETLSITKMSRMVLSLSGDTPTTDRIFNAFEVLTVPVVLSSEYRAILQNLPWPHIVPWHEIIHVIDSDSFSRSPVRALSDFVKSVSNASLELTIHLMHQHRLDVLWHESHTRTAMNLLSTAMLKLYAQQHGG
mmetsp:Transcript_2640/g.5571  ORF Transcript_2640/g.5571 Transcript_2640/m.5571 type:complete len:586 (-) Transcript_2640:424-2181(-)